MDASAVEVAACAAERDPKAPTTSKAVRSFDDLDGPALENVVVDLESRHPITRQLVHMLPVQLNYAMMHLYDARRDHEDAPPIHLSAYRAGTSSDDAVEIADGIVAAGYVLVVEAVYHKLSRLRESLAVCAAASASALRGSFAEYDAEALAIERRLYGWL